MGINLTGADTVIFLDSDWNPQIDLQVCPSTVRPLSLILTLSPSGNRASSQDWSDEGCTSLLPLPLPHRTDTVY